MPEIHKSRERKNWFAVVSGYTGRTECAVTTIELNSKVLLFINRAITIIKLPRDI